jgi:hypothetical protein
VIAAGTRALLNTVHEQYINIRVRMANEHEATLFQLLSMSDGSVVALDRAQRVNLHHFLYPTETFLEWSGKVLIDLFLLGRNRGAKPSVWTLTNSIGDESPPASPILVIDQSQVSKRDEMRQEVERRKRETFYPSDFTAYIKPGEEAEKRLLKRKREEEEEEEEEEEMRREEEERV